MAGSRLPEEASLPVIRWLFEIVKEKTDVIWHIKRADLHLNRSILNNSRLGFQRTTVMLHNGTTYGGLFEIQVQARIAGGRIATFPTGDHALRTGVCGYRSQEGSRSSRRLCAERHG